MILRLRSSVARDAWLVEKELGIKLPSAIMLSHGDMAIYGVRGNVVTLARLRDQISADREDLGESMVAWVGSIKQFLFTMKEYFLKRMFQWSAIQLRTMGHDVRLVKDNPKGTLTFQGQFKYAEKIEIPKRRSE